MLFRCSQLTIWQVRSCAAIGSLGRQQLDVILPEHYIITELRRLGLPTEVENLVLYIVTDCENFPDFDSFVDAIGTFSKMAQSSLPICEAKERFSGIQKDFCTKIPP